MKRPNSAPRALLAGQDIAGSALLPPDYGQLLGSLQDRIKEALLRASLSVNLHRLLLYWDLGQIILARQQIQGWGTNVIGRLATDLTAAFPGTRGFSLRNLKYMKDFAEAYPDPAILQQLLQNCPWGHHMVLLDRLDTRDERLWYVAQSAEHGWSRNVLVHHIEGDLYRRQGKAITNFSVTLPPRHSDLAQELTRGHYNFDFLQLNDHAASSHPSLAGSATPLDRTGAPAAGGPRRASLTFHRGDISTGVRVGTFLMVFDIC